MDNTKKLPSILSFCTGYGGIELGLERALGKLNILAHVEIEAFAIANLVDKMETDKMVPAPIWTNLKTFRPKIFRNKVDILTGGYPCQPFSQAGKRKGKKDPRHLWPWIRSAIKVIKPRYCFFENVEGHVSLGLREVLTDLVKLGYRVENDCGEPTWGLFSAAEVGAPHQRKRVFILCKLADTGHLPGCTEQWEQQEECSKEFSGGNQLENTKSSNRRITKEGLHGQTIRKSSSGRIGQTSIELADTGLLRQKKQEQQAARIEQQSKELVNTRSPEPYWISNKQWGKDFNTRKPSIKWPARPGELQHEWEESRTIKSELGRAVNGSSSRVDRLRLLGNGVVPQTAEKAFLILYNRIISPDKSKKIGIQMEMF